MVGLYFFFKALGFVFIVGVVLVVLALAISFLAAGLVVVVIWMIVERVLWYGFGIDVRYGWKWSIRG